MAQTIKLLAAEQTVAFDTEYVDAPMFSLVQAALHEHGLADQSIHLMDVGGGVGKYVDRFLHHFPLATATVIEPEKSLLDKNIAHDRKTLSLGTFQSVLYTPPTHVVQFNWVLHHFISDNYEASCDLQLEGLQDAYRMLEPGGIVVIFENFYEGWGWDDLPGTLIHAVTSSSILKPLAQRLGANTAGVGVCFHSENYWRELLAEVGFESIRSTHCYDFGNLSAAKKVCLGLRAQRVGLLVARKPLV